MPQQDYTTFDATGTTIGSINYVVSSVNIYWDGASSQPTWQTNTPAKWCVFKVDNPIDQANGTNNMRVRLYNNNTILTLGADYFLQVCERYVGSGAAPYPFVSGPNKNFTGWRDAQMSNAFASGLTSKTGDGMPCFINASTTNDFFVETINQNTGGNVLVHYLRFGLPHNSSNKITKLIVSFG